MSDLPSIDDVREEYATRMAPHMDEQRRKTFDRWIAAHDREVKAEVLRDAADIIRALNPGAADYLDARADNLEAGT